MGPFLCSFILSCGIMKFFPRQIRKAEQPCISSTEWQRRGDIVTFNFFLFQEHYGYDSVSDFLSSNITSMYTHTQTHTHTEGQIHQISDVSFPLHYVFEFGESLYVLPLLEILKEITLPLWVDRKATWYPLKSFVI